MKVTFMFPRNKGDSYTCASVTKDPGEGDKGMGKESLEQFHVQMEDCNASCFKRIVPCSLFWENNNMW